MALGRSVFGFALGLLVTLSTLAQERVQTRVGITSQPDRATVYIDGRIRGQTPLMLFDLDEGVHHLKYHLNGYEDVDDYIDISEGPIINRSAVLTEEKGLLLLKTDPAGCQIKIDGATVGETPRFIGDLTAKDVHTVQLSKTGYRDQTLTIRFKGREPIVREEKLILDSGVVNIITEPANAEVTVNGIVKGRSPILVSDLPKGTAIVRLKLDGYNDEIRELRLNAGDRQTLSVPMLALPGTLHIVTTPAHASVYLNDEIRGLSPLSIPRMSPGEYIVRCEAEGFAPMSKTITIDNGKSVREEFRLNNVMGRIELKTTPVGASVLLDGKKVGETEALAGINADASDTFSISDVVEGEHAVIIRMEGYHDIAKTVNVKAQGTVRIPHIYLKKAFVPDIEITTTDGTFRGVYKGQTPSTIILETTPGVEYPFPRDFIRKVEYLTK